MITKIVSEAMVKISELVYIVGRNYSRQDGNLFTDLNEQKAMIKMLYGGYNNLVGRVIVRPLSKEEQESAYAQLATEYETLKNATEDFPLLFVGDKEHTIGTCSEQLRIFQKMHCNDKGVLQKPKYELVDGNRRYFCLLLANVFRFKKGLDLILELPCTIKEYKDGPFDIERIADCIGANTLKLSGNKELGNKDKVRAANEYYIRGGNENGLARLFPTKSGDAGRGMAQKLFPICELNNKHPDLKILDKIFTGEIDITSFTPAKLRELRDGDVQSDDVLDYMKNPKGDKDTPVKAMSQKEIAKFAERSQIHIVKAVLTAVLKHDVDFLVSLAKNDATRDTLNAVYFPKVMETVTKEGVAQLTATTK